MKRLICFLLGALVLQFGYAVETHVQNVKGAEFKPGALKLPLIVMERSGVERNKTVVSAGVPFPKYFIHDLSKLAVVDKDGKPVISQGDLMIKWHKPVYDDSAQWVLVSFLADCPADGTAVYYLTDDGKTAVPKSPLKLSRTAEAITVETGVAKFTIPLSGTALLSSAVVAGKEVLGAAGLQNVIISGAWEERGLAEGTELVSRHEPDGVIIEEQGAARIVVAVRGKFSPGDKDGKFYQTTCRMYFDVGSASMRLVNVIANGDLDPKLHDDGWRYTYNWPIKDASLTLYLMPEPKTAVKTIAEGNELVSETGLLVHQDSSGGDRWQLTGSSGKNAPNPGVTFRGYKIFEQNQEKGTGNVHPGAMSVSSGDRGVSVALRYFNLEAPHTLAGSPQKLKVGLFPGEFKELFGIKEGQRKSWDMRLTFFAGESPDLKKESAVNETLLLFRPDPAWMARCAADGCWPYGFGVVDDARAGKRTLRRDTSKLDGESTGCYRHGIVGSWNSGGHHWNEETKYLPWILWGDGASFDSVEAGSLWCADLVSYNYPNADPQAFYLMLMGWNSHENRIKHLAFPGWQKYDNWGMPDKGHCGMLVVCDYYYLTGDRRARETIENMGLIARSMLWQWNHDDKNDGTGPAKGAIHWCKRQDADADPNFKLDTRYVGWPLFNLANAYRISGDPALLDDCRNIARAFRNTSRWSPNGFPSLCIEPAGGTRNLYAFQGPFEKYRDLSASQCYAPFQMALMGHGLFEYYQMSRDIEALDSMIGFADFLCHHSIIRDPEGKRQGWTYAFADYWGPYTWEDSGKAGKARAAWSDWHYCCVETLGWTAQFTGREDYVDTLRDAVAAYGQQPAFDAAAAIMATAHPHAAQPATAITDLKAEALGDGKIILSWTTPTSTTKLASYQVKYSTSKIVERVEGWPDRTEPLPKTPAEWVQRVKEFNSKQRAFWSAINLNGAPVPSDAGKKETMVADGIPAGKIYVAIKSWTVGDTMSDLSNVVALEVK